VKTCNDAVYTGKRHSNAQVCGVSILRAGETMELALCEVYKDCQIGKILIQTNEQSGEAEVICSVNDFDFHF
jgi:uracil phosphoribosyltransferase